MAYDKLSEKCDATPWKWIAGIGARIVYSAWDDEILKGDHGIVSNGTEVNEAKWQKWHIIY